MHELAHYIPALLFGTSPRLSILPSFSEGTAGKVTHMEPRFGIAKMVISLMPALWYYVLYLLLNRLDVLHLNLGLESIDISLKKPSLDQTELLLLVYVSLQMLWAGSLSKQDWTNALEGIVSLSGFVMLSALYLCVKYL